MPLAVAFDEIASKAGSHFDPECVAGFLRLRETIQEVLMNQQKDQEESREELGQTYSLVRTRSPHGQNEPDAANGCPAFSRVLDPANSRGF